MKQGLDLMKYALNHPKKLLNYRQAFNIGFAQAALTLLVESVSIMVILSSQTTNDVVFNFIALAVISEFDNYVFESLRHQPLKELVNEENRNKFLKISFTTSGKAVRIQEGGEASDQVDDFGETMGIKIGFWRDRSCCNKLLMLQYRIFKSFFAGFYFYFYPMFSVVLTFLLPFIFMLETKDNWVQIGEQALAGEKVDPDLIKGLGLDVMELVHDIEREDITKSYVLTELQEYIHGRADYFKAKYGKGTEADSGETTLLNLSSSLLGPYSASADLTDF